MIGLQLTSPTCTEAGLSLDGDLTSILSYSPSPFSSHPVVFSAQTLLVECLWLL